MHISIGDKTLAATGFDDLAEGLQFFGLTHIELSVERPNQVRTLSGTAHLDLNSDDDVTRLREQSERSGIKIAAFLMPNNFNAPDPESEIAWAARVSEVAVHLEVPTIRIDAIMTGQSELPLEERQEIFARAMRQVLERTAGLDVDFGIENHGAQGNDPQFLDGLLALVGSDRLGLTLDAGNFYWAGHPLSRVYEILKHFAPVTKHTHIKNIAYPAELRETQRAMGFEYGRYVSPLAEGDIDLGMVVGFLRAAGYTRDLCIEDESLGRYEIPARRANIRAAVDLLRELAGSGDG